MKVLLLMAGNGSRFANDGYKIPKPFLPIPYEDGEIYPMYQAVLKNLSEIIPQNEIVNEVIIATKDKNLNLDISEIFPEAKLTVKVFEKTTEGALDTALQSLQTSDKVFNNESMVILNCDQIVNLDKENLNVLYHNIDRNNIILTFKSYDGTSKWSFIKTNKFGSVTEIKEKQRISDIATVGIYFFHSIGDFIISGEQMIENNERFNNEFYLAPVYNRIKLFDQIVSFNVNNMYGLGTPEDYQEYLEDRGYEFDKDNNILYELIYSYTTHADEKIEVWNDSNN